MSERMIPLKIADMAVAACNEEIAKLQAENVRLKAEVERLRKAGDAMADFFVPDIDDLGHNYGFKKSVESVISNWNAAKEGKPSETKSPSFIEDLGNGVEKHDLLFRYPAKEGKQS